MSSPDAADEVTAGDTGSVGALTAVRQAVGRVDERVAAVRADATRRRVALVVGLVAGLGLAWVHWLGLVAAGGLVGLTRRSLGRALLAGLGVGVLALGITAVAPAAVGPDAVTAFAPASYAAIGLGLVLPAWGSLVRGVV